MEASRRREGTEWQSPQADRGSCEKTDGGEQAIRRREGLTGLETDEVELWMQVPPRMTREGVELVAAA